MAIWSEKQYNRINWKNRPSTTTPLGQTNLNKVDVFCNSVDNALIQFDAQKLNISVANSMLASVAYNDDTGVWTFKTLAGTTYTFNQNIEKIPVSFTLTEDGVLVMTTEDGTEWECNIADLIKDYVFDDSETIAFEKEFVGTDDGGKGSYHVTASVKNGSITADKLNPDYRADILTYKTQAQEAANDSLAYSKDSKRWAVGDAEYEGSATDNSKYYKEQAEAAKTAAEQARDEAQAATGAVIATTTQLGVVKPDGTTIGVEKDGTIKSIIKAASLLITDNQELVVEKQGEVAQETTTQALIDAIADKVANQLVTNTALTSQLANYVTKAMMSNVQVNDQNKVPTSALAYAMQQQITENEEAITGLNSELINGSGLGLTEGMYSIYAPNTADDMVYPGLYRLNGITVGSMTDYYGYAIVMSSLDHTIIKQLIYHNDSNQSLLRYRFNNQWTDAVEFALKDDLTEHFQEIIPGAYLSDPNLATTIISHVNGWSGSLKNVPEDFTRCWGVLITVWENQSSIGLLDANRVQSLMYNEKTISRYYGGYWTEWGKS